MQQGAKNQRFDGSASRAFSWSGFVLLFVGFTVANLFVLAPSLNGPFISDDYYYILDNPFTTVMNWNAVVQAFDPGGSASLYVVNYAPLHILAHGLERAAFGTAGTTPYHVVNILLHSLNTVLVLALFLRSGVSRWGSLAAAALFSFHPAAVEATAWISQLKTQASLALALGALLALRAWPGFSALLFALALLFKASALFALPMAAAFAWAWRLGRTHWGWLAAWVGIALLYAVPQMAAFEYGGRHVVPEFADPWVQLRTIAAIGTRYLAMAATSYGAAPLQQPAPVLSPLNGWWLASIPIVVFVVWRVWVGLRSRTCEAAWWLGAAAAFAPISQLFPFIYPMADRYLYIILPGLLGGVLLAGQALASDLRQRGVGVPAAQTLRIPLVIGWAILLVVFVVRSHDLSKLWSDHEALLEGSALHYPDGVSAHYLRARGAALRRDGPAAVAALSRAIAKSEASHVNYYVDPGLAPLRGDPVFLAFARERAGERIAFVREQGYVTQHWLRVVAHDHLLREELPEAQLAFEQALRAGGPRDSLVVIELDAAREMALAEKRGEPIPQNFQLPGHSPAP